MSFESNRDSGLYFWAHTKDGKQVVYSNRPHYRLPHLCPKHGWYSSAPCLPCNPGPPKLPKTDSELLDRMLDEG